MKYKLLFIGLWTLIFCACTKEELRTLNDSDRVYVNISYNNTPIEGAFVFVDPEKEIVQTNNLGIAILNENYKTTDTVSAYQSIYGGAKAKIQKNEGTNYLSLHLQSSVLPKNVPVVQVLKPQYEDAYLLNETVDFYIDGNNIESDQSIELNITSNLDGVLYEGSLPENGILEFSRSNLSQGLHTIEINTIDVYGLKYTKTIKIQYGVPEEIQLLKAERKNGSVELCWEKSLSDYFKAYEIYISNDVKGEIGLQKLVEIEDRNTTTYTDKFPPFYDEVYYFIRVKNYLGLYSSSNLIKVEQPNGEFVDFIPTEAFVTKNQDELILWNKENAKLLKYDLNELKVEYEKELSSDIIDIDIDQEEDGNIYTVNNEGKIYVYSSQDLSLLKEVNYDISAFCIMYMGDNKVMLSGNSYDSWNENNHVVDLNTGNVISKTGNYGKLIFKKIPGKNAALSITTTISPIDMTYYEWDNNGKITLKKEDSQHGDYPLSSEMFVISDMGNYCISDYRGAVYTADEKMEYKGKLLNDYYSSHRYCIVESMDAIYGISKGQYYNNEGNLLTKYSLQEKTQIEEYNLKGIPQQILSTSDKILIVSLIPGGSNRVLVEVKPF